MNCRSFTRATARPATQPTRGKFLTISPVAPFRKSAYLRSPVASSSSTAGSTLCSASLSFVLSHNSVAMRRQSAASRGLKSFRALAAAASPAAACNSRPGFSSVKTQRSSGSPARPNGTAPGPGGRVSVTDTPSAARPRRGSSLAGERFGSNGTLSVTFAVSPRSVYCRSVGVMMPR